VTLPVTAVVPAYEAAGTLPRALESVLAQRPAGPAEVLVVDDGSRDAGARVARELGATVLVHDRNRGLAAARNTAVGAATQPWLAFLDADDEWLPHHLATLWSVREGHDLVAGSALAWGQDVPRSKFHGAVRAREIVVRSPAVLLASENYLPVSAALARTDAVRAAGGFRPHRGVEDLDLWVRLVEHLPALVVPAVTVVYHLHAGQMSGDKTSMHASHLAVVAAHAGAPWWSPELAERYRGALAWDHAATARAAGRHRQALGILVRTLLAPTRARGLMAFVARRLLARREAARWSRDGSRAGAPPEDAAARAVEAARRASGRR
jgi:hypothetical protein